MQDSSAIDETVVALKHARELLLKHKDSIWKCLKSWSTSILINDFFWEKLLIEIHRDNMV